MKFREQYPTGFIGPQVFKELCGGILTNEESNKFGDLVFSLYGRRRKGNITAKRRT
jgi:hypothetical protein